MSYFIDKDSSITLNNKTPDPLGIRGVGWAGQISPFVKDW